jgi:sialate O-acetylesterase
MPTSLRSVLRLVPLISLLPATLLADITLDPLFGDHAVLQSGADIPVWGTGAEGEKVTVRLAGSQATTTTKDGRWQVRFAQLKASATPTELVAIGTNTVTSRDVLVGEVWLCSGQSNMGFTVSKLRAEDKTEAFATALPQLRYFTVKRLKVPAPATRADGVWKLASGPDFGDCSAVGYYFGRALLKAGQPAVGLINSSWGGTPAEAWTSAEGLQAIPAVADQLTTAYEKALADYPNRQAWYAKKMTERPQVLEAAKAAGKPAPKAPNPPDDPRTSQLSPTLLYNGMIAPIIPVAMRGVIWYQGENNHRRAHQYETLLPAMVADWRGRWARGSFPFLSVQVAPCNGLLPEIRESQVRASDAIPNSGIVCTLDVGDAKDIHPVNKRPVGERLARLARAHAYGEKVVTSGPRFQALKVDGSQAIVSFTHTDGGLVANANASPDAGKPDAAKTLGGFMIAGADQKFVPATAVIAGNTVMVSSPEVAVPVAVRYGWAEAPESAFTNGEGLPAFPFRSDAWPVTPDKL